MYGMQNRLIKMVGDSTKHAESCAYASWFTGYAFGLPLFCILLDVTYIHRK